MSKKIYNHVEIWFAIGSQDLYGEETLRQVAEQSKVVGDHLADADVIPAPVVHKGTLLSEQAITRFFQEANSDPKCAGVMLWMHTFSPSKMWINGLKNNKKPLLHLHTQFHRDIPWDTIDMDYMNLNQSAHGGREHGFINSRLRINRKVVVGHWQEDEVLQKIGTWVRAAVGALEMQCMRVCRFGDNMREVAVTEGDKVAAQMAFGFDVYGYGVGDLAQVVEAITEAEIDTLIAEYEECYELAPELKAGGTRRKDLRVAARLEAGMEKFLVDGNFTAFTTTFEDLHGIAQLPGLACQRLMEKGYGFAAEGDWKTAALLRLFKIMGKGLDGGSSFMEDYTYNLNPANSLVLGSHMLEVCPTVASDNPVRLEIHPLGIGGKEDPVRMVFQGAPGAALNATLIDMGNRFRLLVNEVEAVTVPQDMPNLPVSGVVWDAKPSLKVAAEAWIVSGGAHHTAYSRAVTTEMLRDYADICDIEIVVIDKDTKIATLKEAGRWNDLYYAFRGFPRA